MELKNKDKAGYKLTKLGWIPESWTNVELKKISTVIMGQSPESCSYNTKGEGLYLIQGNADIKNKKSNPKSWTTQPTKKCKIGDILMSVRAPVGTIAISLHDACIGRGMCSIKATDANHKYLYQFLLKTEPSWKKLEQGSTFSAIASNDIKNLNIPLPPLPEQEKIAAILSTWDLAIEKTEKLITQLKLRKKGLMQELLTGKTRLKGFSGEWKKYEINDLCNFKNGQGHEKHINQNGKYIVVNSKFISTESRVKKYTNECLSPLKNGDITLVMSDIPNGKALGKAFLVDVDEKYTLNQRICSLTPKNGFTSKFLYYKINRNSYFLKFNDGVNQTNLRKEEVQLCPIKIPAKEEQIEVSKVLENSDKEIENYEIYLIKLKKQKKGLMQQLLTGELRVSIK